jgi:hypothetical protein
MCTMAAEELGGGPHISDWRLPMRSIPILVLAFAVCLVHAVAASGPSQQAQATPEAECLVAMPATASGTADQLANPACRQANVTPRLAQRRPGFWIAEDVRPGSGGNTADSRPALLHAADPPAPEGSAACVSYPLPVVVGGQSLQATVVACPQPDGSWRATQYTPGLPPQVYTVPPPAAGASTNDYASPGYYQDWGSDWAGGPWFWGFAPAIVVVHRFHFFHGFNHGFAHGFTHGFAHGFAHGSAAGHGGFAGGMHR